MVMYEHADLYEGLSKELWGILHFEMPLDSLYEYLKLKNHNISLSRFMDFIIFPFKIPLSLANEIYEALEARLNNPDYLNLLQQVEQKGMKNSPAHALVIELLYIQSTGNDITTSRLQAIFDLSTDAFYSISLQLVELGYCSSETMMKVYMKYHYIKREREGI
ncbi:hypothetical protein [Aneurinibacillus tyrosinisolvens]|uniref:hypothetical protein n=1 Tax=Aneurinibacillus tyrosinisolvens TaxID=1443435 RepID=UPI00063F8D30|nr:hypothetical protein [Aneurinibacillus tyrosinisolvens]